MKTFLNYVPLPMCGLILGLAALGNLLFIEGYATSSAVFFVIALVMMVPVLLKIMITPRQVLADLENPVVALVARTFTMAWMLICTFLKRLVPMFYLWLMAVGLHSILMLYSVVVHILPDKLKFANIYPSWFITFVGIGVISNTAKIFALTLGKIMIWVALALYFILLPVILKRISQYRQMKEVTWPLITSLAAPGSLCLSGYLTMITDKSLPFIIFLVILSQTLYFAILYFFKTMLKVKFYPSYGTFTFPMVITATAMSKTYQLFADNPAIAELLRVLMVFETWVAVLIVCYVLICYLNYFVQQVKYQGHRLV
ncbi:TDT family transporter [Latilactobacillus sakei]|uniref:TDT family transporter n=1 Tax=Latilactobacillus sakei TaxID=1599 RepID=UPI00388AA805